MRSTLREAAHRANIAATRGTLKKPDDNHLWQEVEVNGVHGESSSECERVQQYGFTGVPKAEDSDKEDAKRAEVVTIYINGNRAHGVIIAIDDRRFRLKNLKEGEVALYDDQGHQIHLTRDGVVISAPKGKKITTQIMQEEKRPTDEQSTQTAQNTGPQQLDVATVGGSAASDQQQQGKEQYGQVAQTSKKVLASFELTKDAFTAKHPKSIVHQIVDATTGVVKSTQTIDENGIKHDTVGDIVTNGKTIAATASQTISESAGQKITNTAPSIVAAGNTSGWNP